MCSVPLSVRRIRRLRSGRRPARLAEAIDCFGPVVRLVYGSSEVPLITDLPFLLPLTPLAKVDKKLLQERAEAGRPGSVG